MLLFDIETNGLLDSVSTLHCLVTHDTETGATEVYTSTEGNLEAGVRSVMSAKQIGGHNVIKYDIPVLEKLYPWFSVKPEGVFDTIIAARLIWTNLKDTDLKLIKSGRLPGKSWGSHSLEAYGYRLGEMKGEYQGGWEQINQEMVDYCVQDIVVTTKLYEKILSKNYAEESLQLEHRVAWLMAKQERNGFVFNEKAAVDLYAKLVKRRTELEDDLKKFFGSWEVPLPDFIPARDNKTKGYKKGVPVKRSLTIEFNPSSRDHISNRLIELYGWEPDVMTESGKPKVDETIIGALPYEPCPLLNEYLMVDKRIAQLAEGNQAWIRCVKNGKIHGTVTTNGAVTGRATHSYPNISQVPSSGSPYGPECRSLFTVPPGWLLVGADQSGLELRCLAHFMAKWDGGQYADVLLTGDIHTMNQQAAGLETRSQAKTFIYAFLYGAGDAKIGSIVGGGPEIGRKLKQRFLKKTPALKKLRDAVVAKADETKVLKGLDGRLLHVRSAHSSLNTLLQSAGAVLCKQWLVMLEDRLSSTMRHGWDGDYAFCAWSHDEVQIACRTPEIADAVRKAAEETAVEAGAYFKFRCPTAGESKVGANWAETH